MNQGTIPLYGNPDQGTGKNTAGTGTGKKRRKAGTGSALAKMEPGKLYRKGADGKLAAVARKKPRKNPSDFSAFAKNIIKTDGMEIAEGVLAFLVSKFLWKKFVAARVKSPTLIRFSDLVCGLVGASFEVYRGKKTGAIVCLSAGVVSAATELVSAKLAGAPVQGADYSDIEDYEIRQAAPVSGDYDGDPVDAILDAEELDQVEGYGDNRGGSFDY